MPKPQEFICIDRFYPRAGGEHECMFVARGPAARSEYLRHLNDTRHRVVRVVSHQLTDTIRNAHLLSEDDQNAIHEYIHSVTYKVKIPPRSLRELPQLAKPSWYSTFCIAPGCTFETTAITGARESAQKHRCDFPTHQVLSANYRASRGRGDRGPRDTLIKLHSQAVLDNYYPGGLILPYMWHSPQFRAQLNMHRANIVEHRKYLDDPYLLAQDLGYPTSSILVGEDRRLIVHNAISEEDRPPYTPERAAGRAAADALYDQYMSDRENINPDWRYCAPPPWRTELPPAPPALVAVSANVSHAPQTSFVPEAAPVASPAPLEGASVVFYNKQKLGHDHEELLLDIGTHCIRPDGGVCHGGWEDPIGWDDELHCELVVPCECTCHTAEKPRHNVPLHSKVHWRKQQEFCLNCKLNLCSDGCSLQYSDVNDKIHTCKCPCMNADSRATGYGV